MVYVIPPHKTSLANTQVRQENYHIGQVSDRPPHRELSLAVLYSDALVVAVWWLAAGWLGLPAAMRAFRLWREVVSFERDEAANDDRFVA
jgi:hypothetical protein